VKKNGFIILLTLICMNLLLSASIFAQNSDNGNLTGTVRDSDNAVVAGATVKVVNLERNITRETTTDGNGRWTIAVLPVGRYEITFEASSFSTLKKATQLQTGTTVVDVQLKVGEIALALEVTAENAPLPPTTNPTTSTTLDARQINAMPSPTRSITTGILTDTSAGADLPQANTNDTGNISAAINGARTTSSSVFFNGIDATNFSGEGTLTENMSPAPETVQELKLQSSLYDASIGRSGGGNIQIVTKSGGNRISGTGYFYGQNEKFNSNDFFFNRDGIERQKARRLEGGFTLGGPVVKDKLFLFGSYQRTDASTAYVPSAQSLVVLPEYLANVQGERTPQSLANAINRAYDLNLGPNRPRPIFFAGTACPPALGGRCNESTLVRPDSPGTRLLLTRNPITGDYVVPTPRANAERLFGNCVNLPSPSYSSNKADWLGGTTFAPCRLEDQSTSGAGAFGAMQLVRQRNVTPADFIQDQFTTRLDYNLFQGNSSSNTLAGTFFFADFPGTNPFPNSTLVSPTPLVKNDRNRTLSLTDTHVFSRNLINEARFGYFWLDNSRQLDERFLVPELTNDGLGIINPAKFFEPGPQTQRCANFAFRGNLQDLSICPPNDIYNQRKQLTVTLADNLTYVRGSHAFRFGVEAKRNYFDTNLPEEQGGQFERANAFNQLVTGNATEADTQFGITDKRFRFNDLSWYVSDEWKAHRKLTLNFGLRWDWFAWPTEKNGAIANFDFSRLTSPDDIRPGFILPSNVQPTGFEAIDRSIEQMAKVDNKHTLNGQDLNNFAPRVGFAWTPFASGKTVIRGGYGIFYDRPSAAYINTVYTNLPFLREIEVKTLNRSTVPYKTAFQTQIPSHPFIDYMPFRIYSTGGGLRFFDALPVVTQFTPGQPPPLGDGQPLATIDTRRFAQLSPAEFEQLRQTLLSLTTIPGGGLTQTAAQRRQRYLRENFPLTGNQVEPIEFRAVDRDLKTPYVQQWNFGIQQQIGNDWVAEARYVGTRGLKLLVGVGFNQPYDLNDPNTPDYIYKRMNDAYEATRQGDLVARQLPNAPVSGNTLPLKAGVSERERGAGLVYGDYILNMLDTMQRNGLLQAMGLGPVFVGNGNIDPNSGSLGTVIDPAIRAPYFGLDPTDSIILQSRGYSIYHSAQFNLTRRFSKGYGFTLSYNFSKSMDIGSIDPGSTTASGNPDQPNLGLVVQGDQRNINGNYALSDFDRPHRFAASFNWELPTFGSKSRLIKGWQFSGFGQWQSGTPFSIFSSDPVLLSGQATPEYLEPQLAGLNILVESRRNPNGTAVETATFNVGPSTGSFFSPAFARPNVSSLDLLKQRNCPDMTRCYFNTNQNPFDPNRALLPSFGGFGNLGRNVLRGPSQKLVSLSLSKTTQLSERLGLEFRWDVFNAFNFANFANPNADLMDETDFGQITRSVGGPRTMQFGLKLKF
jgi:carboxypeptidase family protein